MHERAPVRATSLAGHVWRWIDNRGTSPPASGPEDNDRIDWLRILPFIGMHLGCLGVLWTGGSRFAVGAAIGLYLVRMLAITGFYHRYFAHRSFKTSRAGQFAFALLGACAVQRGPLWWAAHHRHHHQHSDRPEDLHSPREHGFLWSHMGWFVSRRGYAPDYRHVRDLAKYPELAFIDRFDVLVPLAYAAALYACGAVLAVHAPQLHTSGSQLLVWGFFISTVACYHATYTINSLAHVFGARRYPTGDDSRNNFLLAILTLGEGWHNNHHYYPSCARQGFYWWEVDLTYYCLRVLAALGIIWDLRAIPAHVRARRGDRTTDTDAVR